METLLIYLVKTSTLLLFFYSTYYFLLKKDTFFTSNRWFFLIGICCSLALPLISFQKIVYVEPVTKTFKTLNFEEIPLNSETQITARVEEKTVISWEMVLGILYGIGMLFFLTQLLIEFYSFRKIIKNKNRVKEAGFELIKVDVAVSPFSFFNKIVYNPSLFSNEELQNIIEHEKIHAKQMHSLDVLIARLNCIIFWWNPIVWLYKKAMIQNLEFIADQNALAKAKDKKSYLLTLVKITTAEKHVAITNHFYQSLIKKRIVMLNKNQSKKHHSWKYFLVFPALIFFMITYQVEVVAQEKPVEEMAKKQTEELIKKNQIEKELSESKKNKNTIASLNTETAIAEQAIISSTSTKVEFKIVGASNDKFLNEQADYFKKEFGISIDYDEILRNKSGKIIAINITLKNNKGKTEVYTVSSDEEIKPFSIFTKIDSEKNQIFGFSASIENQHLKHHFEAIERNNNNTSPKQVILTSDEKDNEYTIEMSDNGTVTTFGKVTKPKKSNLPKNTLIILDGKVISIKEMQKLDPNLIKSVAVIKRQNNKNAEYEELFKKHGKKATNGIIIIETVEYKNAMSQDEVEELANSYKLNPENNHLIIHKRSDKSELEFFQKQLAENGIKLEIAGIERNPKGFIMSIKFKFMDEYISKKMSDWTTFSNPDGIPDISIGRQNGKIILMPQ